MFTCPGPDRCARSIHTIPSKKRSLELIMSTSSDAAVKGFPCCLAILLFMATSSIHAQSNTTNPGSWSGILVSSACNADEAFNESPECNKNVPGAEVALYDDTTRVMYRLEPQQSVTAHLGDAVTVCGTLDGESIRLTSIEMMSIGLAVGQKAPAFSLRDQFGRVQTLDTLRGAKGTVLLFFRSADW